MEYNRFRNTLHDMAPGGAVTVLCGTVIICYSDPHLNTKTVIAGLLMIVTTLYLFRRYFLLPLKEGLNAREQSGGTASPFSKAPVAKKETTRWTELRTGLKDCIPYEPENEKEYPCEIQTVFRDFQSADQILSAIPGAIAARLKPMSEGMSEQGGSRKYHVVHEGMLTGAQFKEFIITVIMRGGDLRKAFARGAPAFQATPEKTQDNRGAKVEAHISADTIAAFSKLRSGAADRADLDMKCGACGQRLWKTYVSAAGLRELGGGREMNVECSTCKALNRCVFAK